MAKTTKYKKRTNTRRRFKRSNRTKKPVTVKMMNPNVTLMNQKPLKTIVLQRSKLAFDSIINPAVTGDIVKIYTFKLSDIAGYTDIQNMFDKYKIYKIKCTFTAEDISGPGNFNSPFYIFKNNNSTLSTITSATVAQQQNVWQVNFSEDNKSFSKTFYPYWISTAFSSAGTDYVQSQSSRRWIDVLYDDILHYGLCLYSPNVVGNASTYLQIRMDVEYTLHLRDTG